MFEVVGKNTVAKVMIDNIEESALKQIHEMTNHPAATNPIAIMPDTHAGAGCVIGFTMERSDKIVPNWIGVDIGCGVVSTQYQKSSNDLDLAVFDDMIASTIPMGKAVHSDYRTEECYPYWF